MKICVVGAGAIGGLIAARLGAAGHLVSIIDVGVHLDAIRRHGLTLLRDGTEPVVIQPQIATSDATAVGTQDLVVLAVKAQVLPVVAPTLGALFSDRTVVLPIQNGIPWWYFQGIEGRFAGRRLETVDPEGVLERSIEAQRLIGCVVYPAGAIVAPGVVRHVEGDRLPIGELDGVRSERVETLAATFCEAGLRSRVLDDIRSEVWLKLWGNCSFNPISALTHATLEEICRYPLTRELARYMMEEMQAVAEQFGASFRVTIDRRIEGAERVGPHKTSMLQDVEAGRALEVDAVVGAVVEMARMVGVATPHIDAIHALVKLLDDSMRRAHGGVQLRAVA